MSQPRRKSHGSVSPETGKKKKKKSSHRLNEPPFPLFQDSSKTTFAEGLASVAQVLRNAKRIVCLTGAGISTSCGIPDFRTQGSGLYSTLDCEKYGLSCAEELFDYEFFQHNPVPFYQFAKNLYSKSIPSDSHKFLQKLDKKLLRVYSQNMDGLEEKAGVTSKKVVYAHGSLQWASCLKCKQKVSAETIHEEIMEGKVAYCRKNTPPPSPIKLASRETSNESVTRRSSNRKRPRSPQNERTCNGLMKPGVTFFGQPLGNQISRCLEIDRPKVDALIVIGTSLSVAPISRIVSYLPSNIPRILINRSIVHPPKHVDDDEDEEDRDQDFRKDYVFDAYLLGNSDDIVRALDKAMSKSDLTQASDALAEQEKLGSLLSNMKEESQDDSPNDLETDYELDDWKSSVQVPHERVFLFAGAQPPTSDTEAREFQEVAYCDGCSDQIEAGTIRKCSECFDYDLCQNCFPNLSLSHFDGTHTFLTE